MGKNILITKIFLVLTLTLFLSFNIIFIVFNANSPNNIAGFSVLDNFDLLSQEDNKESTPNQENYYSNDGRISRNSGNNQDFPEQEIIDKTDSQITEEFEQGKESVRVIVILEDEEVNNNIMRTLSIEETEKKEIMNIIPQEKIDYEFISFNGFSADLTKEEIYSLEKESSVKKIEYDEIMHPLLQDTTPLIGAVSAWNSQLDGINLTGTEETVCVIDTGVYYLHPDLGGGYGEGYKILAGYDFGDNDDDFTGSLSSMQHGTGVSGIVSASGGINGVAKGSNLVFGKVMNSEGIIYSSKVNQAIEWCTSNSEIYNISVISLSLGSTTLYDNYCDSYQQSEFNVIRNAVAKNISVVAGTGNKRNYTSICSPACLSNTIAVGGSSKSDFIVSGANSWDLEMLVAPSGILSTCVFGASCVVDGLYTYYSGTSFSTPHVSGAIAIINQYLRLKKRTMTPKQIESLLYGTGITVWDPLSQRNYSRINVYNAIMKLDIPSINLISPEDNTFTNNSNQNFIANFSDLNLKNSTLHIWDNQNNLIYTESKEIQGTFNKTNIIYSFTQDGVYSWNYEVCDNVNNCVFADNNFTIKLDITPPIIEFSEETTNSGINYQNWIFVNVLVNEDNFEKIIFTLYNSTSEISSEEYETEVYSIRYENLTNDFHKIKITVFDNAGNFNSIEREGIYIKGLRGDVNNDGVVDAADSSVVLKMAVGSKIIINNIEYSSPYSLWIVERADVNEDGVVNMIDSMLIQRISAGLEI
jgi:serine protease AprX